MKRLKLFWALCLLMAGVTSAWAENPSGTCGDNLTWEFNPSTGSLTITGTGDMYDYSAATAPWYDFHPTLTSIVLPDGLTHIGNCAFYFLENISDITIPSSVTSIGEGAFKNSNLASATISSTSVGLGKEAFYENDNLTTVTISGSVTGIGDRAFTGCEKLTAIDIPSGTMSIGEYAFYGCTAMTSVSITGNVTDIGMDAFQNCDNLATFSITGSLTSIGEYAFSSCSKLASVTLPAGLTSIGTGAFEGCTALTSITLPSGLGTIGSSAFAYTGLTSITIPASVTNIGNNVFTGCPALESISVEAGNATYDSRDGCNAIIITSNTRLLTGCKNTVIPNSVTSIGNTAFSGCTGLTSIDIPSSITQIRGSAFKDCTGLKDVYVHWDSPISPASTAFDGVTTSNVKLHVPAGTYTTYAAANVWKNFNIIDPIGGKCGDNLIWSYNSSTTTLTFTGSGDMYSYAEDKVPWKDYKPYITSIVLPEGLTIIGGQAFQGCTSLPSIDIPSSVTMIYGNAFNGCTNLETVTFAGSNLTLIGGSAFKNCTGLTSITLPNSVATISAYAFSGCTGLTSVTLSEDLTTIANYAFQGCSNLHDVTVHWTDLSGITTAASAFNGLTTSNINLHVPAGTYATYAAVAPWSSFKILDPNYFGQCGETLFWEYNPSNTTLTITGSGAMYDYTDSSHAPWYSYKGEITSATMSADMTHQGNYAFYKCTALTSATFADGSQLTSIGKHAFDNCSALTSIEIPSSVTSLGGVYPDGEVFYKCSALTSVNIPDGITFIGDNTFYNCYSLSSVSIPNSVTQIGHHAFANCTTLVSVTIPAQVQYITNNMFNGCSGLETVTFAEGSELISLGNYAFYNCTKLSDLYVPWMANPLPTVSSGSVFFGSTLANVNLHLPFAAWSNYETATTWKKFKQVPVVTAKADPENDGVYYNTFYHGSVAYALPTGVEAYTAQRDGTDLILTKIAQAGDVLPAGTAVILKSSVQQFEMTPSEETPVTVGENDLLGKDASEAAPANCYVLSGPNPSNPDITEVGFYQFSGTLGAHKAYIVLPSGSGAPKRLRFVFDSTQDIEEPTSDSSLKGGEKILLDGVLYIERGERMYNAQGQMVR